MVIAFHIGGEESEYVRVTILRDNGDDWLSAQVEVVVGGFRGSYLADFNSWSFSDFLVQLEKLYQTIAGSASFTSYEGQLELVLACDVHGHIKLQGEAIDFVGTGNKLIFQLGLDQTYIPAITNSLRSAIKQYPVRVV